MKRKTVNGTPVEYIPAAQVLLCPLLTQLVLYSCCSLPRGVV